MRTMGCRALALGLAVAVIAPLAATTADAAVVICQKKNKLKLRVDTCTAKETQVPVSDLVGDDGLLIRARVEVDGTLGSAQVADGLTVTTSNAGGALWLINLAGTGAFTGLTNANFIINTTCESNDFGVSNAYVDPSTLTADNADIYVYCWVSSDLSDSLSPVFVTVHKGD